MTTGAWVFISLAWVSLMGFFAVLIILRQPRRRKPVDELEAADAALRLRMVDLEDKFEHHLKRDAVRTMREKKESAPGLYDAVDPLSDRRAALAALRSRVAAQRGVI